MRGELTSILHQATRDDVEYRSGDSIRTLDQDGDGVEVSFDHGPPRRFGLVVGADGLHSEVRRMVAWSTPGNVVLCPTTRTRRACRRSAHRSRRRPSVLEDRQHVDRSAEQDGREQERSQGEPPLPWAPTRAAKGLGPAEQRAHADARHQDPAEGPGPVDGRLRPGDLGHEPSEAGRPSEPAEPSHQGCGGRATAMTGLLVAHSNHGLPGGSWCLLGSCFIGRCLIPLRRARAVGLWLVVPGAGVAWSCCMSPIQSTRLQCSTIWPSVIRKLSIRSMVTCLPVGGTPQNGPRWVPWRVLRVVTLSPSPSWSWMTACRSGRRRGAWR
jgi:hypothetical protein